MTELLPIADKDIGEVCAFLHANLNGDIPTERWRAAFSSRWMPDKPNNGYMLRNECDQLVGIIGSIYSRQTIRGTSEVFCNTHSWCVLDDYRKESLRLLLAQIKGRVGHLTALTPNEETARIYRRLQLREMTKDRWVIFNVPSVQVLSSHSEVLSSPEDLRGALAPATLRIYEDHADYPSIAWAAFGATEKLCLVAYKSVPSRGGRSAWIMHVSDPEQFIASYGALANHLFRSGLLTAQVDCRLLHTKPRFAIRRDGSQPKLFYSKTLSQADISNLYSEIVCLDL